MPTLPWRKGHAQGPITTVTVAPVQAAETDKTTPREANRVATPEAMYTHTDLQAAAKEALGPTTTTVTAKTVLCKQKPKKILKIT